MNTPELTRSTGELTRYARILLVAGGLACLGIASLGQAADVRIRTTLGDIELDLLEEAAPITVANFLKYIADGDFDDSFFHRSVPGFIIQSGGFTFVEGAAVDIPADPPITNEFGVSNTRGTVAMAKLANQPDSATSEWFINLGDNADNLDNQNGGFTVFARVVGNGMAVADLIAGLPIWNAGGVFTDLPLIDFQGDSITLENLVMVSMTLDSDGDGTYDDEDDFPSDPSETTDTDGDGIGNVADTDDDGDGLPDDVETDAGLDPLDPADAAADLDGDGFSNLREYQDGTDMTDPRSNFGVKLIILKMLLGRDIEDEADEGS